MANNSHLVLRDINDNEIDFKSPIDEDLMARLVNNLYSLATMLDGQPNSQFKAQSNGVPTDGGATSVLTLDTITQGVFERDDQYNTKYILVTSGPASGSGTNSRFPITDCDEGALTFTCGLNKAGFNLNESGMIDDNTFEVIGHVHDGTDGETISFLDLDGLEDIVFNEYTESGKSQSRSGTTGPFGNTHNLILPINAVDYFLLIDFSMSTTGAGSAEIFVDTTKVHAVQGSGSEKGGAFLAIAQNGDGITAHNGDNGTGGTMSAQFDILAYQKVPV
jgi:hypothetical protein